MTLVTLANTDVLATLGAVILEFDGPVRTRRTVEQRVLDVLSVGADALLGRGEGVFNIIIVVALVIY